VIAVHGLNGTVWKRPPEDDDGPARTADYINSASPSARILTYDYNIEDEDINLFTDSGIRDEALRLLDSLLALDRPKDRNLILMGHDVGGVLIKEVSVQFGDKEVTNNVCVGSHTVRFWS